MKSKTVLTIELERVSVIVGRPNRPVLFCMICRTSREFVSATEAVRLARFLGIESPEIFHFCQTIEKEFFVCLNSIFENHPAKQKARDGAIAI